MTARLDKIRAVLLGRRCREDFRTFLHTFWGVLNPGVEFLEHRHLRAIIEHCQAWVEGRFRRFGVALPPGQGKSMVMSIYLPVWVWCRDPHFKFLSVTHTLGLSLKFNEKRRILIDSERFRAVMRPNWDVGRTTTASKSLLMNSEMGEIRATAIGAGITGEHFGAALLDDLLKPEDAYGAARLKPIEFWYSTLQSRLMPREDPMVGLIMQRLCEGDPFDEFSKTGFFDCRIVLPAIYDAASDPGPTPLGWADGRKPGELLDAVRIPASLCEKLKAKPRTWATQYQQSPMAEADGFIPASWWRRYKVLPQGVETIGWDLTYGDDGEDNDMCSGQCWLLHGVDLYLVDLVHGVWNFPEMLRQMREFARKHPRAGRTLVEKKASGAPARDMLYRDIPGLIPWTPHGPKESRIGAFSGWVEAGNIYLPDPEAFPETAAAVAELVHQCAAFGQARYDDLPDCASMVALAQGRALGASGGATYASVPATVAPRGGGKQTGGLRR